MKAIKTTLVLLLSFAASPIFLKGQTIEQKYKDSFSRLIEYHSDIKYLNQSLEKLYPVAIMEDSSYYIFEFGNNSYFLARKVKKNTPLPDKIRAAFPLAEYDNQFVCVVTGDVFDTKAAYATIFHEFVHCYQGTTVEWELKSEIDSFNKAIKEKNYMWELNHAFPYENNEFAGLYKNMVLSFQSGNPEVALGYRTKLKTVLSKDDFDYMSWEEWKEGFARYIENLLRDNWGLERNTTDTEGEMNRVWFYEGGSLLIAHLLSENEIFKNELRLLYSAIIK